MNGHAKNFNNFYASWGILALTLLSGCAITPPPIVQQPMSARPPAVQPPAPANGSIYSVASARPLFEDRRARNVGDTLVISISEKTEASKKSNTSADKSDAVALKVPVVVGVPGKSFQGAELSASGSNKFAGKGESAANNDFTGVITVTVVEVLSNGNLVVSGEKQVAVNQGTEFVRFSGVVNPNTITGTNTVISSQVADARIEYRANGVIDEAQVMGWLGRFFMTFLPF